MEDQSSDTSDEVGPQIRHLGDLVIQAFRNLKHIYESQQGTNGEARLTQATVTARASPKEIHYDRLHSSLLPLLKELLTTITNLLFPGTLRMEAESRFRKVLELLPELDFQVSQVDSAVRMICPGTLSTESQTDDHDLKRFKRFRLIGLKEMLDQLLSEICVFLHSASEYIETMDLSSGGLFEEYDDENNPQAESEQACYTANRMIKHLNRSELDVAEGCWAGALDALDELFKNTFSIVTPNAPETSPLRRKLVRQPVIQLTQLTLPIIKLIKLFFKKLSKDGMNHKRRLKLPSFTQMNSHQLDSLSKSAGKIAVELNEIVLLLTQADLAIAEWHRIHFQSIIKIAERLPTHFEPALLSVVLYLIPLVAPPSDQKYYQTWFVTWNILINTALHNFRRLARSLNEEQ
ncbi:uncharacterized protein PGTG_01545 [Puccinia graminis f. sp. tritici CRL 75-36-700-3]|uniref:Uncharacterized protein n=1 Tax=Puccinia graminis f. sp. tritici (strain CRL 75-36-700-3 / race SCCL) TaxID=418459 RepID=E3JSH9_PUCGT|nr:uncharacterized protein PGTG_01545 [Puccinia graminis f. sp. tritici CRL 75-36-700-3]EFP74952.1 hypothetical protein PGTG_01545 [Puccinia graminis f. sp. tritici CRL 75-36-700-3]